MRKLRSAVRGALCTAGIFALAVLLCVLLQRLNVPEHITTVMVFAVFLISLLTDGYVFGVVSALLARWRSITPSPIRTLRWTSSRP